MYRVLNCLAVQHDWRLVFLAAGVCFLASGVAVSLFHRAQVSQGRARPIWLGLDAAAAGFGIWATHFIAMLAYDPGTGAGYDVALTVLSLFIAILITGVGLAVALSKSNQKIAAAIGGAVVGGGVAAMHYTGMSALEVPARLTWSPDLVIVSIVLGVTFAGLALYVAALPHARGRTLLATALLTLAIVSMHFTAMGAVLLVPDPTRVPGWLSLSPNSLSLVVAAAAAIVLGMCFVCAMGDRHAKDKLREQKLLLDAALANMAQGLCMFQPDGRIILYNERYSELTGLPPDLLDGHSILDVIRSREWPGDPEEFVAEIFATMREGKSNARIVETAAGRTLRVVEQPRPEGGWVSTLEDITEWQQAQAKIQHMARHDALTNLPNRRLFKERLEDSVRRVTRGEGVAVFCLDLDHFKEVNDTLGHPIGDELLQEVARRLSECVRETDTVARLGGDEFAIVQAGGETHVTEASTLATRLVEIIGAPYLIQGQQLIIGTTLGISISPDDGLDPDELLKKADMALYRAKGDGRGGYRFFEPGMDARAQARRILQLDLRAALSRSEFELRYQPLLDIKSNKILSFEAQIRWNHPQRGLIPLSDFASVAEETRLIVPIGDWALRTACTDATRWPHGIHVAVNMSPAQFKNRNLVASVRGALLASGLAADRLELEITETVLLHDTDGALATLHKLRELGAHISMDDFGTGCSSLSYLRSFPFDKIKIDRSFVSELAVRKDSMAIVRAVTGLGRSLGIPITADGVETSDQMTLLRSEGCNEVQGHLVSPALPASEVDKMLSNGRLRVVA